MIEKAAQRQIYELLENAQNPLFFFDNDADGFCSFLIFQRTFGRGRGVPIKSYPALTEQYLRKVDELYPDMIIVLDKAEITQGFVDGAATRNIPLLWIDHHSAKQESTLHGTTHYFNSYPSAEPVTYIAQKVCNRSEDLWLAMIGCIADVYTPDFATAFEAQYPELYDATLSAFEALHATEIGKFTLMINFGLMNTTTNVVKLIKYFTKASGPYDLLEENFHTKEFHARYNDLYRELQKQIEKARTTTKIHDSILYFSYASQTSMSAILASRLYYESPDALIIVAYKRPEKINLSIRGHDALRFTEHLTSSIEGATGGGHLEATGAMIPASKEKKLLELLSEYRRNDNEQTSEQNA